MRCTADTPPPTAWASSASRVSMLNVPVNDSEGAAQVGAGLLPDLLPDWVAWGGAWGDRAGPRAAKLDLETIRYSTQGDRPK